LRRLLVVACAVAVLFTGVAAGKPPLPNLKALNKGDQKRLLERVKEAPAPYRRLLRATYSQTKVRPSDEVINGSYITTKVRGGEKRFVVFLDQMTRKGGEYGDFLTVHELGHVIANEYFDEADYQRFFDLFRQSPDWQECFETAPGFDPPCDFETEILADQLAFYATGNLEFRSSYDIPPLADEGSMAAAIEAGS